MVFAFSRPAMALFPAPLHPRTARPAAPALKRLRETKTKSLTKQLKDLWAVVLCARIVKAGWRFWKPATWPFRGDLLEVVVVYKGGISRC